MESIFAYPETILITEKVVAVSIAGSDVYFAPDFTEAEDSVGGAGRGF